MEADQAVGVIHNINMSDRKEQDNNIEWENSFSISDASLASFPENDVDGHLNYTLEDDLIFVGKHAPDADLELVHSLLMSQLDNPKRLETVMCEVLNIPNALELIKKYRKTNMGSGEKRSSSETESVPEGPTENKRRRSDATDEYLSRLSEMFPNADRQFLKNECQHLKSEEDFSRFINTVMLTGVYTKKDKAQNTELPPSPEVINVTNDTNIADVIDITDSNDSTVSYNPQSQQSLNELYNALSPVREPNIIENIHTPFDEEIDNVFKNRGEYQGEILRPDSTNQKPLLLDYILDEEKPLNEVLKERTQLNSPEPTTSRQQPSNDIAIDLAWDTFDVEMREVEIEGGDPGGLSTEKWTEEQTSNLIRIFPNTDPSFLREEVVKMNGSADAMNTFVIAKLERNDMPTRADYEKKREMEELQNRYTKNFSIQDFLKAVPDPWKHFTEGNRNCSKYEKHSLCYLRSSFRKHYVRDIINIFKENKSNLYLSYKALKMKPMKMRGSRRSEFECNVNRPTTIDIQFLQEVAFIENEEKIQDFIKGEELARKIKFEEAKQSGSLLECQCCFDSEIMVEDIVYCPKDHAFCKDCVIKCVEVEMGNGKSQFNCLATCEEKFTLASLQNVLKPELFSKVIRANQMEEIQAAGIEDLVQCPFCTYATIMPPEQKVMSCLNPECLKESCRLCKELNHIPLKCDEVEKSEEVKLRTFIENKMTEALVRTCYKCGKKFVKEDGCNKMTCTCGAKMCYVCRKPVTDYSHFNGQGGTEYHKCPLYSTNDELHVDLVQKVGEEAKARILQANPETRLLYDPTVIMPERTHDRPLPGVNNNRAARLRERRAIRELLGEAGDDSSNDGELDDNHQEVEIVHPPYFHRGRRREIVIEDEDDEDYDYDDDEDYDSDEVDDNDIEEDYTDDDGEEEEGEEEEEEEEEDEGEGENNNRQQQHRHHHYHHHHHHHHHHRRHHQQQGRRNYNRNYNRHRRHQ